MVGISSFCCKHVHLQRLCCSPLAVLQIQGLVPWKHTVVATVMACQFNPFVLPLNTSSEGTRLASAQSFLPCHDWSVHQRFCLVTLSVALDCWAFSQVAIPAFPLVKRPGAKRGQRVIVTLLEQSSSTGCSWWTRKEVVEFRNSGSCWATSPLKTAGQQSPLRGCRWSFFYVRMESLACTLLALCWTKNTENWDL